MFKKVAGHLPASHIVVNEAHLYPLMGFMNEGIGHQASQGVVFKNIHIEVYVVLCRANIGQQGREKIVATGIDVYLVVFKRQCEALVCKQLYKGAIAFGYV